MWAPYCAADTLLVAGERKGASRVLERLALLVIDGHAWELVRLPDPTFMIMKAKLPPSTFFEELHIGMPGLLLLLLLPACLGLSRSRPWLGPTAGAASLPSSTNPANGLYKIRAI